MKSEDLVIGEKVIHGNVIKPEKMWTIIAICVSDRRFCFIKSYSGKIKKIAINRIKKYKG